MNCGQLLDQALNYQNTTKTTADSLTVDFLMGCLNELQDRALSQAEPNWAQRHWKFLTTAPYTTGTIGSVTNGSSVVTGDVGTAWDDTLEGRKLRVLSDSVWYDVVSVSDTVTMRIDPPYSGSSTTSATYAIYQDEYPLPGDFRAMISVRDEEEPNWLRYEDAWSQDHRIPRLFYAGNDSSTPYCYTIAKRERTPLVYVTNGPVTLTQFSNTLQAVTPYTTSVVTDDARFRGAYLRMSGTLTFVQIRTTTNVTSTNASPATQTVSFLLYEPWRGATVSVTGYEIVPKGQYRIGLWPVPQEQITVECRYYHQPEPLVNFEDVPILPREHHDFLWLGAAYRLSEMSGSEVSEGQRAALYRSWQEAEQRMLRAMSPNRDGIWQRGMYGAPNYSGDVPRRTVFDGPGYPANYPKEWTL